MTVRIERLMTQGAAPHYVEKRAPAATDEAATTGTRSMRFVASDESTDSYGDVVVQSGWNLARFKTNPIFILSHDYRTPIGTVPRVAVENKRLMADVQFAEPGVSEAADQAWRLAEAKILRAVSVGFNVNSTDDYEYIRNDEDEITGYRFLKPELIELSLVAVPANPNALSVARSFGIPDEFIRRVLPLDASILQRQSAARLRVHQQRLAGIRLSAPRPAYPNKPKVEGP